MARQDDLSAVRLRELLAYDPNTGVFLWRSSGSGRKAGQPAGSVWNTGYRFIHIAGVDHQASRLAWLYMNGSLPQGQIRFADNDPSNLSFANLRLARTKDEMRERYRPVVARANRRNKLKLYDGLTIDAYNALLDAQGGVCAICKQPETTTRNGKVRWLCVDHCHTNGHIRGLLCVGCNTALGYAKNSPEILRACADYLEADERKQAAMSRDSLDEPRLDLVEDLLDAEKAVN